MVQRKGCLLFTRKNNLDLAQICLPSAAAGRPPAGSSPEQMASVVAADMAKWAKLIRERKIAGE